jgi:hypothetical protein
VRRYVAIVVLVCAGCGGDDGPDVAPGGQASAACAALVEFEGRQYLGATLDQAIEVGKVLGSGTIPPCVDTVVVENGTTVEQPTPPPQTVRLSEVKGISPSVAVARAEQEGVIYVAEGVCEGIANDRALLLCLRRAE